MLRLIAQLEKPSYGEIRYQSARHFKKVTNADIKVMETRSTSLLPWKSVLKNTPTWISQKKNINLPVQLLEKVGLKIKMNIGPLNFRVNVNRVGTSACSIACASHSTTDEPLGALDALTRLEMQISSNNFGMSKVLPLF